MDHTSRDVTLANVIVDHTSRDVTLANGLVDHMSCDVTANGYTIQCLELLSAGVSWLAVGTSLS